jgi:hypothetical protein
MTSDFTVDEKKNVKPDERGPKGLPATLENPGFASEAMILCGHCKRTNPPTRLNCIYCGKELGVDPDRSDLVRLNPRRLESWEKGFNVVRHRPRETSAEADLRMLSNDLALDRDALQKIMLANGPMPFARVENEPEADLICSRLRQLGIDCIVLTDGALDPDRQPRRLRGLEFSADEIVAIDFNTGEYVAMAADDLVLIVIGTLFERKTASLEKRKKSGSQIIDQAETASDESVVDLYSRGDHCGLRIYASGFDFSCLGSEKNILAAQNMPRLVRRLSEMSPAAKLVEEYVKIRNVLDAVWELESRKNSEGLRRSGFGKADFGNVVTVTNLSQFNRYSRMQRHLV